VDNTEIRTADYPDGYPGLNVRVMCSYSEPGTREAAFLKYEDTTLLVDARANPANAPTDAKDYENEE